MGRRAELMVHDELMITFGNEADHLKSVDDLARVSYNIADIYAERAGGDRESWRDVMRAEQWYSAEEAVAAGLADRVAATPGRRGERSDAEDRLTRPVMDGYAARAFRYCSRKDAGPPMVVADAPGRPAGDRSDAPPVDAPTLPEREAVPGEPLPELPDSAYPPGATPLDPVSLASALRLGIGEPRFAVAPADMRSILDHEINNRPAPPEVGSPLTRTAAAPAAVDLNTALMEGIR